MPGPQHHPEPLTLREPAPCRRKIASFLPFLAPNRAMTSLKMPMFFLLSSCGSGRSFSLAGPGWLQPQAVPPPWTQPVPGACEGSNRLLGNDYKPSPAVRE